MSFQEATVLRYGFDPKFSKNYMPGVERFSVRSLIRFWMIWAPLMAMAAETKAAAATKKVAVFISLELVSEGGEGLENENCLVALVIL